MNSMPDYYRSSQSYAEMLRAQDTEVFTPYINLFKQFINPGEPVIDIGCGVGTSTLLLREAGFEAVGTDVSDLFLPCQPGIFKAVDFQNASDIPDNAFAAAASMNVIEHVSSPKKFLAEMSRVVQPGGHIILLAPNLTSPIVGIRIIIDILKKQTPYLGVTNIGAALALIPTNFWRSLRAELGSNVFEERLPVLDNGIVGYDADAVYWTNATEIRRFLESLGFEILLFQGEGKSASARVIARLLPGFASKLRIVARKKPALMN